MDMSDLMKQAQELQAKVAEAQNTLGNIIVKGIFANGECIVEMTGKYDLVKLTLAPSLLERDPATIAAIISEAYRDAKAKADAAIDKVMSEATAGMPMPE
jgi:DNA-binding YbaB/EbfC family protein